MAMGTRVIGLSTAGIVFWCLGAVALGSAWWTLLAGNADGPGALCGWAGLALLPASGIAFLVAAANDRTCRGRNCACCSLTLFTLIVGCIVGSDINSQLRQQEAIQHTTETLVTLHKLGAEIESIQSRLGRLPKDEEELVALRGKPMPTYYREYQIQYCLSNESCYELRCSFSSFWGRHWDLFGWIVSYSGPNSPQRIHVELF